MSVPQSRIISIISAAAALLALGVAAGYWGAHRTMPSIRAVANAGAPASRERKILYWHDPMKPEVKFDKPGKSPFMDMDLVPVYADEASENVGVRIDPSIAQNIGIRLGKVERRAVGAGVHALGTVAFDERLLELVQARVNGYVKRLAVKAPFERVRQGQVLAEIVAPEWAAAEQEYLALLEANSPQAKALRDAARQRLIVLGVSDSTIRAVETTRKTNAAMPILAPREGVITELGAREGAAFAAGATLFRINGLSTVWVNAQISESQVALISASAVDAHANAWPGLTFKSRSVEFLPQVDPQSRTATARVTLKNPDGKLPPGMYVTLDFTGNAVAPQLTVPSEAIIATGTRTVVVTARQGGGFDVANVTTGADIDGHTVILSGLTEGQSIVLSGQFLIDSEASLTSTLNRLQGSHAPQEPQP